MLEKIPALFIWAYPCLMLMSPTPFLYILAQIFWLSNTVSTQLAICFSTLLLILWVHMCSEPSRNERTANWHLLCLAYQRNVAALWNCHCLFTFQSVEVTPKILGCGFVYYLTNATIALIGIVAYTVMCYSAVPVSRERWTWQHLSLWWRVLC